MKYITSPNKSRNIAAIGGMAALMILAGGATAGAQEIRVTIDGENVPFAGMGPQQINGRTMVPVRGVLEKLGANVSFNSATRQVTATTPDIDIQLVIGSRNAIVNAQTISLDVPAQSINDHTFVPLRFLGEALGAEIRWDPDTRTVVIITKGGAGRNNNGDRNNGDRNNGDRGDRGHLPPPPQGPTPVINSFSQNSSKWLRSGGALETSLEGTPGGRASFRIPGVVEDVPMREESEGHYVGSWQVPPEKRFRLKSAAVIGTLTLGAKSAPLIQAGESVSIDTIAPAVRDLLPEDNTNMNDPRPTISAAFDDEGSGIDRNAVRLIVNGRDVTASSTITRDFITYRSEEPLEPGMQQVELKLQDVAGNNTRTRWAFIEKPRVADGIKSVNDNVKHDLQPGDTIHMEMVASPGGKASFNMGTVRNIVMLEEQPGKYVADYTIRRDDDVADRQIAYHLVMPDGQKFVQTSKNAVRTASGRPMPPVVLSPAPNEAPRNPLVVSGRANRNARVQVRVEYKSKVLGVIAIQGSVADVIVQADRMGNWQTEPINLGRALGNKGSDYTITAVAVNGSGESSEATIVRFKY